MPLTVKWFPPSWVQLKTPESTAYIDPSYMRTYYRKHPSRIEFSKWPDPIDGLPENLETADLILLTHDHKDHAKDVTIDRLRSGKTLVIGPERCRKKLGPWVSAIFPGETVECHGMRICAVNAYNTTAGGSSKKIHRKGDGVGYLVRAEGKTIYHAGDTDLIPDMESLGRIDLALLPIGGTYTMDVEEAVRAAAIIRPKAAAPIHHLKADPLGFAEKVQRRCDAKPVCLAIGEPYRI